MLGGGPLMTTVLYFPGNLLMHLTVTTLHWIDVKFLLDTTKAALLPMPGLLLNGQKT